jgi:hypothetical protein
VKIQVAHGQNDEHRGLQEASGKRAVPYCTVARRSCSFQGGRKRGENKPETIQPLTAADKVHVVCVWGQGRIQTNGGHVSNCQVRQVLYCTPPTNLSIMTPHNMTEVHLWQCAMRWPRQIATESLSSGRWILSSLYLYSRPETDPFTWTWAKQVVRWMVSPRITTPTKRLTKQGQVILVTAYDYNIILLAHAVPPSTTVNTVHCTNFL